MKGLLILITLTASLFSQVVFTVCDGGGCDQTYNDAGIEAAFAAAVNHQDNVACVPVYINLEPNNAEQVALLIPTKSRLWNPDGTPASTCQEYVTVRTASYTSLPANGVRVARDSTILARLGSASTSASLLSAPWGSGGRWKFQGIEFYTTPGTVASPMVAVGAFMPNPANGMSNQDLRLQPHHYIFSHCWIRGNPNENGPINGLAFHGANLLVEDSIIEEIHHTSSDAAAFLMLSGTGPTTFKNNYIAGSGQNWFSGGGIPAPKVIPSDHQILGNHMEKPFAWAVQATTEVAMSGACYVGMFRYNTSAGLKWNCPAGTWASTTDPTPLDYFVKPTIEMKNGKDALIKGNYLNNGWHDAQQHNYFLANQVDNNVSPNCDAQRGSWTRVENIEFAYNRMEKGYAILGIGGLCAQNTYFVLTNTLNFHNNLATNLADPVQLTGATGPDAQKGRFGFFNRGNFNLNYSKNTVVLASTLTTGSAFGFNRLITTEESKTGWSMVTDNIFPLNTSSITGGMGLNGGCQMETNIKDGAFDMRRNVMVNTNALPTGFDADSLCTGFGVRFPATGVGAAGSVNVLAAAHETDLSNVVDSADGYRVKAAFQGKSSTWGRDPGADIDMVEWATAGAVAGTWPVYLDMKIRSMDTTTTTMTMHYTAPSTGACTVTVSETAAFGVDLGSDTHTRRGRAGKVIVTGLTAGTNYAARLTCDSMRVEEQFRTAFLVAGGPTWDELIQTWQSTTDTWDTL
jgi:hypothetical protein